MVKDCKTSNHVISIEAKVTIMVNCAEIDKPLSLRGSIVGHAWLILTLRFLFESTLFPRKRGWMPVRKAGKDRDTLGSRHAAWCQS